MKLSNLLLAYTISLLLSFSVSAQQKYSGSDTVDVLQRATDLEVMLAALAQVKPVPFDSLPKNRFGRVNAVGFWSMQNPKLPPFPGNFYGLDVWPLGDGVFVLDDRAVDYPALQAAWEAEQAKTVVRSPMMRMALNNVAVAYGNPVYLTNLTVLRTNGVSAAFDIAGGTNNVPYDILATTNLTLPVSAWSWLGIGYTSNRYSFSNQPNDMAFYRLAKPSKTMVVAWGENDHSQGDVLSGLTNAVQVAGGYPQSLALLNDGTLRSWGDSWFTSQPTNLTGVAMVACGWNHNVVLLTNGTVRAWGYNGAVFGWNLTSVPAGLTNVAVISAQALHSLALKADGTVVSWGSNQSGQTNVPVSLTNVTAIAAGGQHSLAVSNGRVVAWGYNHRTPTNLTDVLDVAAGWNHSVALKADGTVVCWGDNRFGQTNVPPNLTNVVAIAAGGFGHHAGYSLALRKDGTIVSWGSPVSAAGLNNVIGIAGGAKHALALRTGPATPVVTLPPRDQYQVLGSNVTFTAKGQGLYGVSYQWQFGGVNLTGRTNTTLTLTNVSSATEGTYTVVITDNGGAGTVTSQAARFYLVTKPVIAAQAPLPLNQVGIFQTNLILAVAATAPGETNGFPLNYQWRWQGTNVVGQNVNYYPVWVDPANLGNYSVVVSNIVGSVTSQVWQVSMTYTGSYIAPGTLAYHLSTNAVGRTNSSTGRQIFFGWTANRYTATNMAALTNSVLSTNFWLRGVKGLSATCLGFSNVPSGFGGQGPLNMVSPRHYLCATHMHPESYMLAFLDTNNVIHWRKSVQRVDISNTYSNGKENDISVGLLNADLPPSVDYLPVMPTNFFHFLPTNSFSYVQGISMTQAKVAISLPMTFDDSVYVNWNGSAQSPFGLPTSWNEFFTGGDSSNPDMILVGNQLVLVSQNYRRELGPNLALFAPVINTVMHHLSTNNFVGSDYQLTVFPLTNWPAIQ